ncbi:hypothetical protein CUR178_06110 [Leishmania enriettii]|uniref:Uncharacterized protein n=1 Tax=Leishmania enriettii TaxID=5663 RepID=A0A836HDQ9_LEIEN|nr:hypothetical protein CUR178_06110 [Leishmania enriettii]
MGRRKLTVRALTARALGRCLSGSAGIRLATAGRLLGADISATERRFYTGDVSTPHNASAAASDITATYTDSVATPAGSERHTRFGSAGQRKAAASDSAADAATASPHPSSTPPPLTSSMAGGDGGAPTAAEGTSPVALTTGHSIDPLTTPDLEPVRWVQLHSQDLDSLPIVDAKGEYIVSRVQWPTGEIAYRTPAPVDDKLAPRFGYNVVQVRKHVSWWKYNQKYPRLSFAYINIQVLFLLGLAWLVALLTTEYRQTMEAMRTPGAMVGEHRGRGPATNKTQKISFEKNEMDALLDRAQNHWYDGKAEAAYVGSKEYKMRKIPRPKEFSADDVRKR